MTRIAWIFDCTPIFLRFSPKKCIQFFSNFRHLCLTSYLNFSESADSAPTAAKDAGPPKFVSQFNQNNSFLEGQSCHLEARLTPVEDANLKVEWLKDGKPIPTGHRFRTFHDFGIVILDILYCYAEDSGVYECRATNKLGTDSISCNVSCDSQSGLILTPQVIQKKMTNDSH